MDYGLIIQQSRNGLFKNLAKRNNCVVIESLPVKYMDFRPYKYSSTVCDFEIEYMDEMIKAIHYNKLPSTIYLGETKCNHEKIQSLLERKVAFERLPIMIVSEDTLSQNTPTCSLFKMIQVKHLDELMDWCRVIAGGMFNDPDMDIKYMSQLYSHALEDSSYILALGYEENTPVTGGLGYISKNDDETIVGSIFMIGTLKAHRGHGYGSKLTYELTRELLNKGADFTVLDASEMGAPIYTKMGYQPVGYTYRFFPNA